MLSDAGVHLTCYTILLAILSGSEDLIDLIFDDGRDISNISRMLSGRSKSLFEVTES